MRRRRTCAGSRSGTSDYYRERLQRLGANVADEADRIVREAGADAGSTAALAMLDELNAHTNTLPAGPAHLAARAKVGAAQAVVLQQLDVLRGGGRGSQVCDTCARRCAAARGRGSRRPHGQRVRQGRVTMPSAGAEGGKPLTARPLSSRSPPFAHLICNGSRLAPMARALYQTLRLGAVPACRPLQDRVCRPCRGADVR